MDELPSEARAFLDAARSVHDAPADPRIKQRLRAAVLDKLAGGVGAGGTGKLAAMGLGAKLLAGAVLLLALGGFSLALLPAVQTTPTSVTVGPATQEPLQPQRAALAPHSQGEPVRGSADLTQGDVTDPASISREPRVSRGPTVAPQLRRARGSQASSLLAEAELLRAAGAALTNHDVSGALAALREHRGRFPHPLLLEERDGLVAIAQCTLDPAAGTRKAEQFIARFPDSVLVVRLQHACRLTTVRSPTEAGSE